MSSFSWKILATVDQSPGLRSRHCLAYDHKAQAAVLYGGIVWGDQQPLRSDTWEFRERAWQPISAVESPPARHRGAMAFDQRHGLSVLFGGQGSRNVLLNDTWI